MRIPIACGTWIRDEDRAVIEYLQKCETFPPVTKIAEETGLPVKRVMRTLSRLKTQNRMRARRLILFEDEQET